MCRRLYQGPLSAIHVLKNTAGTPTSHSLRSGKAALPDAESARARVCVCPEGPHFTLLLSRSHSQCQRIRLFKVPADPDVFKSPASPTEFEDFWS